MGHTWWNSAMQHLFYWFQLCVPILQSLWVYLRLVKDVHSCIHDIQVGPQLVERFVNFLWFSIEFIENDIVLEELLPSFACDFMGEEVVFGCEAGKGEELDKSWQFGCLSNEEIYKYLKFSEYPDDGKSLSMSNVLAFLAITLELIQLSLQQRRFRCEIFEELKLVLEDLGNDGEIDGSGTLFRRNDILEDLNVALHIDELQFLSLIFLACIFKEKYCSQLCLPQ